VVPPFLLAVRLFLKLAKGQGADQSYIAQHRRAWWAVCFKDPALCGGLTKFEPKGIERIHESPGSVSV